LRRDLPPGLAAGYAISFGLAILLFFVQGFLAVALAGHGVLWRFRPGSFDQTLALLTLLGLALNGFALARAVKARHFLGLFAEWPGLPEEKSSTPDLRLLAISAQQAFFHRDFDRCIVLLDRFAHATASPQVSLAKGRALVLAGRFEEALPELERGRQGSRGRRYLSQRRSFFFWTRSYFKPSDILWSENSALLAGLGVLSIALCLPLLNADFESMDAALFPKEVSFSTEDFKVATHGSFTLYYHDEVFMQRTADIADDALAGSLEFLDLPASTFGPGQIQLFLCSDQKEYLARSPYTKSWEGASALPEKQQVYLYRFPDRMRISYEVTVAHELTHLCYYKVLPGAGQNSWLNEGFADYMGYKFALERAHYPRQAWLMNNYFVGLKNKALPFQAFLDDNPQLMGDTQQINTFYVQGFSIVYVLIEQYGRPAFLRFLRVLATGKTLADSLAACYPTIRSAGDLGAVWDLFMR
jgi:hypothetical protein